MSAFFNRPDMAIQMEDESFSISNEEFFTYIGINVAMGLSRLPKLHDYWSTTPIFCLPWFLTVMSRDRFFIYRYLHLVDSSK